MSKDKWPTISNKSLGTLIVCAIRYSLGRQTYMPSLVQDISRSYLQNLDINDLKTIMRDITEAKTRNRLGDLRIDAPGWIRLNTAVAEEICKRGGTT